MACRDARCRACAARRTALDWKRCGEGKRGAIVTGCQTCALPIYERDPGTLAACLHAGAAAFLLKDISLEALIHSLKLAMLGQKVMPTELAMALINGATGMQPAGGRSIADYGLSDREMEILRCLVNGDANKVIANRLDITEATVKVHMKSLLRKITAATRTQAAIWALNQGLAPGHRKSVG